MHLQTIGVFPSLLRFIISFLLIYLSNPTVIVLRVGHAAQVVTTDAPTKDEQEEREVRVLEIWLRGG